ncbi:UBC-like protein [Lentithecium fluviatile CBS 122367]|uniref:UBC-like protein n=1 Tax=Lentithecium fluviatile CBS 122367 TaxID=1168545 RepID=A0A6G1J875_9PLEO|nr:UBC-like protein [Lentithecium fluviatile CBS 122367]
MSTRGQFNTKNPTIKRILKEASELASQPSPDYHAEPLEDNLFEWHFTFRGPPAPSPYANGIYHGRIVLPPQYPLRPPSFRFLTSTGRFEVNREICLSISGHHEETWQPAWGIRTALVAMRSFMDTDAKGQLGGLEASKEVRERMAREGGAFKCGTCGKTNKEILAEREEMVKGMEEKDGKRKEEVVPEELRLAYRDELGKKDEGASEPAQKVEKTTTKLMDAPATSTSAPSAPVTNASSSTPLNAPAPAPRPTRTVPAPPPVVQQIGRQSPDRSLAWIDTCIYGIGAALIFMILKKIAA